MFYRKSLMLKFMFNTMFSESIFVPMKSKDGDYILDFKGFILKQKINDRVNKKLFLESFYEYYAKSNNYKYEIAPCFKFLIALFTYVTFKNEFNEYVYKIMTYNSERMSFEDDICITSPFELKEKEVVREFLTRIKLIRKDDPLQCSDEEFYDDEVQSPYES